nr:unnamed protein product [Digitaria exilis]
MGSTLDKYKLRRALAVKRSANAPERMARPWREAPRAPRPRAAQHLSAAGREAGTDDRGAAEARIRRNRDMASRKWPWAAATRIW